MPRIPVYQQQVQQGQLPGVRLGARATSDMFDGGLGAGGRVISQALDKTADIALTAHERIKKKEEAIWVQERLAKLAQNYDTYTYGTPDGQTPGVLSSKGLAASQAAKGSSEYLDKAMNELLADAPSQDAMAEFRARALSVRTSTASTIARHATGELNRYHAEAAAGNAQIQMESIAADYNQDPESFDRAFQERVAPSLSEAARLTGKPVDEVIRGKKAELYQQVITQSLAEGNTRRANDLLGRWSDALDAKARAGLTDKIRTETIKLDADEKSMLYAGQMEGGRSYSAIMDEINGIEDRDLKVATRSAFRAMASQIRYERSQAEQEASMNAVLQLDTLGGDLKAQYDFVNSMPEGKAKKHALARYKQYSAAEGRSFMTDPGKFDTLIDKITFAEIRDEKALLADPDAAHVAKKDLDILKNDLAIKQGAKGITSGEYKEAYLRASGKKSIAGKDKQDVLAFLEFARNKLAESNRGDDPDYVQKLADTWFLQGEKKGSGWGYGSDTEFRQAVKDPTWVPDAIADDDARSSNQLVLTNSMLKDIVAQGKEGKVPGWAEYLKAADGDERLAARMSWGNYIRKNLLGPRTRSK